MPKHHELCTRLENAAKRGELEKTLWMTHCHFEKFIREGRCEGKILDNSKRNNLIKVTISWKNACKSIESKTLQEYIDNEDLAMPSFGFKLYIIATRAQQST